MNTVRTLRPAVAAVPVVLAALLLAGCGGSSGSGSAGGSTPTGGSTTGSANGAGQGANRQPGVFGLVAQISGKTLQVQATSSQTAVTYTASTRFTATVATTKQAVKVGSCVLARSAAIGASGATGTPTARPTQPTAITATEVTITAPTNGRCAIGGGFGGGFGGGGGFRGGAGAGQATPGAGAPTGGFTGGAPTGGPGARGFFGGDLAIGKVTAVSGSGFTVAAETFAGRQGSGSSTQSASPSVTTRSVVVTTTAATTYTTTAAATAKALAVGKCVSARGASDSTGAVTATSIAVTSADNGSCAARGA